MYIRAFAVLALVLSAGPAFAASNAAFGRYTCAQRVPCETVRVSPSQWAEYGNACITEGFGYTNPGGFISDVSGLDSSNCMTAIPNSIPNLTGTQLKPLCCVIQRPDNTCSIHCDIVM